MGTVREGLYTFLVVSAPVFFNLNTFRQVLENIKRNISCSLTSIESCALDEIIDIMC